MVGRLGILQARENATAALGKEFNLKDFHYQVMYSRFYNFTRAFVSYASIICLGSDLGLARTSVCVNGFLARVFLSYCNPIVAITSASYRFVSCDSHLLVYQFVKFVFRFCRRDLRLLLSCRDTSRSMSLA